MKRYLVIFVVLLLTGLVLTESASYIFNAFMQGVKNTKHKNFEADKYSAEWGCLVGSNNVCSQFENEKDISDCREEAMLFCPKAALAFEKFLKQSYNGAE